MNRPNVLIVMTDQQRGDTVYPFNKAITPNITKFAKEGVTFSNAHTVSPHCCPARATFFSGLYPTQHGVWNNVDVGNTLRRGLYDNVKLFSEDFKENGYGMYYVGKWHVSHYEGPLHRGFDYNFGDNRFYPGVDSNEMPCPDKDWSVYSKYKEQNIRSEGEILRRGYQTYTHYATNNELTNDDKLVKKSIDVIKNRKKISEENKIDGDAPWVQYVGLLNPHDPYFAKQKYLDMYDIEDIELPESFSDTMEDKPTLYRKTVDRFRQLSEQEYKESLRHYYACCSEQDDNFGKILEALEESGEADNTIVIYMSDHGDYTGDHGLWCKGLPCFEGAYHIPLVVRYPEGIQETDRVVDDFVTIADVAPTLLDMCDIPYEREMVGVSLKPYLENKEPEEVQDTLYTQSNGNELYGIQRSVRTAKWKYVYNGFDYDEFYDLENDPNEMTNLYEQYKNSEILKEMSVKMWKFAKKTSDVCVNPYIMVGLSSYGPGVVFEEEEL